MCVGAEHTGTYPFLCPSRQPSDKRFDTPCFKQQINFAGNSFRFVCQTNVEYYVCTAECALEHGQYGAPPGPSDGPRPGAQRSGAFLIIMYDVFLV